MKIANIFIIYFIVSCVNGNAKDWSKGSGYAMVKHIQPLEAAMPYSDSDRSKGSGYAMVKHIQPLEAAMPYSDSDGILLRKKRFWRKGSNKKKSWRKGSNKKKSQSRGKSSRRKSSKLSARIWGKTKIDKTKQRLQQGIFKKSKDFYMKNRKYLDGPKTFALGVMSDFMRDRMDGVMKNTILNEVSGNVEQFRNVAYGSNDNDEQAFDQKILEQKEISRPELKQIDNVQSDFEMVATEPFKDAIQNIGPASEHDVSKSISESFGVGNTPIGNLADMSSNLIQSLTNTKIDSKTASTIAKIGKVYQEVGKAGRLIGEIAQVAPAPIGTIVGGLTGFMFPQPNKMDIMSEKLDVLEEKMMKGMEALDANAEIRFQKLGKQMNMNYKALATQLNKGLNTLNKNMISQFDNVLVTMNKGFLAMTDLVSQGVKHINERIEDSISNADKNQIEMFDFLTKQDIHKELNMLMENYREFSSYPFANATLDRFRSSCKSHQPYALLISAKSLYDKDLLDSMQEKSHGEIRLIRNIFQLLATDVGLYNMIVPACETVKVGAMESCRKIHESAQISKEIINNIIDIFMKYDSDERSMKDLYTKFLTKIIFVAKKVKFPKTRIEAELYESNSTLFRQLRQTTADNILLELNNQYSDYKFTVVLTPRIVYENPNYIEWPTAHYVYANTSSKKKLYGSTDTEMVDHDLILFWHYTGQQPSGKLFNRCIDEKLKCWYDKKPVCSMLNKKIVNLKYNKNSDENEKYCTTEEMCTVKSMDNVPSCKDGKHCFQKCSEVKADTQRAEVQHCFNEIVPCYHSHPSCTSIAISSPSLFFKNGTNEVSINSEPCVQKTESTNFQFRKNKFIGGYSAPSCVTDLNGQVTGSTKSGGLPLNRAIVKATNLDCTTIFGFPSPLNLLRSKAENFDLNNYMYADWDFENIINIGDQIVKHHEMKSFGICLLGIIRAWQDENFLQRMGIASSMNGASFANLEGIGNEKHFAYRKNIVLNTFEYDNGTIKSNSTETKLLYPFLIYIVKHCEAENDEFDTTIATETDNFVDNCEERKLNLQNFAIRVKNEHEDLIRKIKDGDDKLIKMKKVKIAIGIIVGVVGVAVIVVVVFAFVSKRNKRKGLSGKRKDKPKQKLSRASLDNKECENETEDDQLNKRRFSRKLSKNALLVRHIKIRSLSNNKLRRGSSKTKPSRGSNEIIKKKSSGSKKTRGSKVAINTDLTKRH